MLDEPLGSLDKNLRSQLTETLRGVLRQAKQTSLYVTHDQEEAFAVADKVVILKAGKVEQIGTPREIFLQPASAFVARFLGFENLLPASLLPWKQATRADSKTVLLRPDEISIGNEGPEILQGILRQVEFRGLLLKITLELAGGTLVKFEVPAKTQLPKVGEEISISFDPTEAVQEFASD
jgi:thiamine transport system ATP-binding protein